MSEEGRECRGMTGSAARDPSSNRLSRRARHGRYYDNRRTGRAPGFRNGGRRPVRRGYNVLAIDSKGGKRCVFVATMTRPTGTDRCSARSGGRPTPQFYLVLFTAMLDRKSARPCARAAEQAAESGGPCRDRASGCKPTGCNPGSLFGTPAWMKLSPSFCGTWPWRRMPLAAFGPVVP